VSACLEQECEQRPERTSHEHIINYSRLWQRLNDAQHNLNISRSRLAMYRNTVHRLRSHSQLHPRPSILKLLDEACDLSDERDRMAPHLSPLPPQPPHSRSTSNICWEQFGAALMRGVGTESKTGEQPFVLISRDPLFHVLAAESLTSRAWSMPESISREGLTWRPLAEHQCDHTTQMVYSLGIKSPEKQKSAELVEALRRISPSTIYRRSS
jgi:hypothetical protein